jgi:hypothetical protein
MKISRWETVVIHAEKIGDKLMANEVRFGAVAKTPHQP